MTSKWQQCQLGDVCAVEKIQGQHRGLPYVGLEHIESGTGRFIGSRDPEQVKSSTFRFSNGHLLYGRLRPYLNKVLAPGFDGHCSTEIFPLKPSPQIVRAYLQYWLQSETTVALIDATCTGARMPRANMADVLKLDFPLPPLPEQRRIVSILDEAFAGLEAMRANAKKNLQNAREIYQAAVDTMLEQPSPTWLEHPFSNLCDIKHGFAFKSEFFTNSGDCVLLTPGNFLEAGGYRDRGDKQKYYAGRIPDGFVLKEGDLLVAMTEQAPGLLGSPIIVPGESTFLHNQRLGLVQEKRGIPWVNSFFFHVFNARRVRREIHVSGSGTKVRHTSPTKIGEVQVAYPPTTNEQSSLADALSRIREESQQLEAIYAQKLAAVDELKQSILQKAFAGELPAAAAVAA